MSRGVSVLKAHLDYFEDLITILLTKETSVVSLKFFEKLLDLSQQHVISDKWAGKVEI